MKVNETEFDQPDVSEVTPVDCSFGRSDDYLVTYIGKYGKYETAMMFWDDIDKQWKFSSNGKPCNYETVRINE